MSNISFKEIYESIKTANNILIVTHQKPDGDAIGSMLALKTIIDRLNISVDCVVVNFPDYLKVVPGVKSLQTEVSKNYDLILMVDTASESQMGTLSHLYSEKDKMIIIDHHDVIVDRIRHYVDTSASSATTLIYEFAVENDIEIDLTIAQYLYIGLLTDTGGFAHNNTTSEALALASHLLSFGIKHNELYISLIEKEYNLDYLELKKIAMDNLEVFDDKIAISFVDNESLKKYQYDNPKEFVNIGKYIRGVEVSIFTYEEVPGTYKVSLRSKRYLDVAEVARIFEGGGHKFASGIRFTGNYNEFKEKLLNELRKRICCPVYKI